MWTQQKIRMDLREVGVRTGMHVIVHTSLRAIGEIEGGAETLMAAFREVLGNEGTLLVPTFTFSAFDPAERESPPESLQEVEKERAAAPVFEPLTTPAETDTVGVFPEIVRKQPDALRSHHPTHSFSAVGALAEVLTSGVPMNYPLGSGSPVARLHQYYGYVLLLGVTHEANTALHLAEVWADAPYIHRAAQIKTGPDKWTKMMGSPGCSEGFNRIEPVLHQARILKRGTVGNAPAQLMRVQDVVSMAVSMLKGAGNSLLCSDQTCQRCKQARKYTAESHHIGGQSL